MGFPSHHSRPWRYHYHIDVIRLISSHLRFVGLLKFKLDSKKCKILQNVFVTKPMMERLGKTIIQHIQIILSVYKVSSFINEGDPAKKTRNSGVRSQEPDFPDIKKILLFFFFQN